ncbi:MAG: protein translocase subunit SecF [Candidatus Bipolaricaulota bacterium]|nr:protein translocase subunit SecF [Candidatus Bipolaricaulota bacterium]
MTFDFLGKSKYALALSGLLVVASVVAMVAVGLRPGIDFTSGIQLVIFYPAGTELPNDAVRSQVAQVLAASGAPSAPFYVQAVTGERDGKPVPGKMITVQTTDEAVMDKLQEAFTRPAPGSGIPTPLLTAGGGPDVSVTRIEPMVTREIRDRAWQAILIALAAMLVYIAWRFRLRYGVAAVVALIHDVVITLGVFAVARLELNLPVIAGLLTVVGYSLNATIIIFDRVRENVRAARKVSLAENINRAIAQTMTRTINTGLTTLIPIVVLFIFGGAPLRGLAVAMLSGVVVGTWSSIFVSNPVVYGWSVASERLRSRRR